MNFSQKGKTKKQVFPLGGLAEEEKSAILKQDMNETLF